MPQSACLSAERGGGGGVQLQCPNERVNFSLRGPKNEYGLLDDKEEQRWFSGGFATGPAVGSSHPRSRVICCTSPARAQQMLLHQSFAKLCHYSTISLSCDASFFSCCRISLRLTALQGRCLRDILSTKHCQYLLPKADTSQGMD